MNSSCTGLKRSMPCTNLISMGSIGSEVVEPHFDVEMDNAAPKRRRISPMEVKRNLYTPPPSKQNPATEALDRFLRMAVDDLTPSFDLQDDAAQSFPFHSKLCSFDAPLKSIPTIHELTCGMARVSASS